MVTKDCMVLCSKIKVYSQINYIDFLLLRIKENLFRYSHLILSSNYENTNWFENFKN